MVRFIARISIVPLGQFLWETLKVIPLKLFDYQTFLKLGVINIHDMNIKKMQ